VFYPCSKQTALPHAYIYDLNWKCVLEVKHYFPGRYRFYRATLCVSAVFAVVRCPSVTFVYCIQTAKDIVKLLSRPSSPIINSSFFWPRAPIPNSKGNSFSGGAKYTRVGKICDFWLYHRLSRKRYRPIVSMER